MLQLFEPLLEVTRKFRDSMEMAQSMCASVLANQETNKEISRHSIELLKKIDQSRSLRPVDEFSNSFYRQNEELKTLRKRIIDIMKENKLIRRS